MDLSTMEDHPVRSADGAVFYGGGPAWDPTGRSVVYTRYMPGADDSGLEIFRVYPDSSGERQLTHLDWSCEYPKWIDGGKSIVFRIDPAGSLDPNSPNWWVIPASGPPAHPFYDQKRQIDLNPAFMAVGPETGDFVSMWKAGNREHYSALWVVHVDATGPPKYRQITGLFPE